MRKRGVGELIKGVSSAHSSWHNMLKPWSLGTPSQLHPVPQAVKSVIPITVIQSSVWESLSARAFSKHETRILSETAPVLASQRGIVFKANRCLLMLCNGVMWLKHTTPICSAFRCFFCICVFHGYVTSGSERRWLVLIPLTAHVHAYIQPHTLGTHCPGLSYIIISNCILKLGIFSVCISLPHTEQMIWNMKCLLDL